MIKKHLDVIVLLVLFGAIFMAKNNNDTHTESVTLTATKKQNENFRYAYESGCMRALIKLSDLQQLYLNNSTNEYMTKFCKDPNAE